ncbi:MAG: nitroreductase family protein [Planctomycetes bacterium]|jgi:nitroreductase|nr:nitroreductase family protein [Planctomycetota bacterium]
MNSPHAEAIADCIRTRRTVKAYTGEAVPRAQLERWLDLACWAPSHRLTQPWRFAVLDQPAIVRLAEFLRGEPTIAAVPDPAKGAAKLAKLLDRLPALGAMIQVTWMRDANTAIDLEEHAAASAAIQNLLLAAHADGWAGFWSTTAALGQAKTLMWCGLDPTTQGFLGSVWLGRAAQVPPPPPRIALVDRVRWL